MHQPPPPPEKGSRRGAEQDDGDDASIASASTGYNGSSCVELEDDELDRFTLMLDDLFEKRGATRERALEGLASALREAVREEDCLANDATITARCVQSLRKGSAQEAASAATVLGLHIITVAMSDGSSSYSEAQPELLRAAVQGKTALARVAATEALAVSTFAACDDERETLDVMRQLAALWRQDSDKARAAAVGGWSLLFTTLGRGLSSGLVEQALQALGLLLHANDVALRAAAGEAVALLYHSCGFAAGEEHGWGGEEEEGEAEEGGEEEEEEGGGEEAEGGGGEEAGGGGGEEAGDGMASSMSLASSGTRLSGLDVVVERMQQLASNKGDGVRRWVGRRPGVRRLRPPAPCFQPPALVASHRTLLPALRAGAVLHPASPPALIPPLPPSARPGHARGAPPSSPPSAACAPRCWTARCPSSACACSTATPWWCPPWRATCSLTA
jgi:hypothetical protein